MAALAGGARAIPRLLLGLLVLAIGLRVWLWVAYRPAIMNLTDTIGYVYQANVGVFHDSVHPAGYGIFLDVLHSISDRLELTIALQHLLGLATGLLLYATVRRFGAPVWAALVGAAAVLLSLDQLFLEHALMSETLFTFLVALSLYACARAYGDSVLLGGRLESRDAWLIVAGLCLGLSATVRAVTLPMAILIAAWALIAIPARVRTRLGNAALAGGAALIVLLGYGVTNLVTSDYFGVGETSGWALYGRTAPFANCGDFEPPAGTSRLCESTPPESRPGADFYPWLPQSPARKAFGGPPAGDDQLSAFSRAAILAQPGDYLTAVAYDTLRFFVPHTPLVPDWFEDREYSGLGYAITDIPSMSGEFEQVVLASVRSRYPSAELTITAAAKPLDELQDSLRVHPGMLLASLLLALAGFLVARGAPRAAIGLLAPTGFLLLLIPAATTLYTARYAIPAQGPLLAAGAIGLWQLAVRFRRRPPASAS